MKYNGMTGQNIIDLLSNLKEDEQITIENDGIRKVDSDEE